MTEYEIIFKTDITAKSKSDMERKAENNICKIHRKNKKTSNSNRLHGKTR